MSPTPRFSPRGGAGRRRDRARQGERSPRPSAAAEAIASPAADGRGSAEYRTKMAGVMTARALSRAFARAQSLRGCRHVEIQRQHDGQRQGGLGRGRAAHAADPLLARKSRPHRPAYRLRHLPLRRLHGRHRRQVGEVLHDVRGAGRGRRSPHHRGHGRRRRQAARAAGRLSARCTACNAAIARPA